MFSRGWTHLGASLEQDGLGSRTPTEGKGAYSFGSPIVEPIQHLVQTLVTHRVHKGFTRLRSVAEGEMREMKRRIVLTCTALAGP